MNPDDKKKVIDALVGKLNGCSDEDLKKVCDALGCPMGGENTSVKDEEAKKKAEAEKKAKEEAEKKAAEDAAAAKKAEEEAAAKKAAEDAAAAEAKKKEEEEAAKKAAADSAKGLTDEQKKEVGDAAVKDFVAAQALASRCEPLFGKIVMDGLRTPQDVAVKVCMMDSALKFVDAGKALDALTGRLDEFEKAGGKNRTTITDSSVTASFDFSAAFASRK